MTESAVVSAVYEDVIGHKSGFGTFDERLNMQKTVYLLNEIGVSCGDFSFRWYKHGPYSQQLQNVMISCNPILDNEVTFSEKGRQALDTIKSLILEPHDECSLSLWLEALGSIHYLKKYTNPTADMDVLFKTLSDLKPNLINRNIFDSAVKALTKYNLWDC